ncbi:MAG: hypothetical protein NZ772_00925 [Cyanobacteria bacterium]|nr:hypothetical protein [Cyanobacteriota bacterium]MDW8199735.1 hypothetical protein [Cyanobacteriota bacterium SKYGB_h_bin112]
MDPEIKLLLVVLKHWQQACKKLDRAIPSATAAEAQLATIAEQIKFLLQQEEVVSTIDELIARTQPHVAANPEAVRSELATNREAIITAEVQAAEPLQLSREDVLRSVLLYLHNQPNDKYLMSSQELLTWFLKLHVEIIQQYVAARSLPRKQKKRRKRNIAAAVSLTAVGVGLILSNTPYETIPAAYSYILGGNALIQALRDLIGEADSSTI